MSSRSTVSLPPVAVFGFMGTDSVPARTLAGASAAASCQVAPISPMTSAYSPVNIGYDSESNVKEQAVAAQRGTGQRGTQESELRVAAPSPCDESGDRRHQEERRQGDDPDQSQFDRRLQELVVEDVKGVVGKYVQPPRPNQGACSRYRSTSG